VDKSPVIRTALSDSRAIKGNHTLIEIPLNGKLNLRGDPNETKFVQGVEQALGLALPLQANTVSVSGEQRIFWLGPNEWLLHCPLDSVKDTAQALWNALNDRHYAITEVSDYFSVLELGGPQSREIIASASPLDIRAGQFKPGQCAQTRFGHASILLWPEEEPGAFGLQIRWSYAQYVFDYLAQSLRNAEALQAFNAATVATSNE